MLGRPRRRGAAPRRILRRLDRRRAHPRLLRASHSVFTSCAADKVSSRPPPSQSPPQRCTGRSFSPRRRSERPTLPRAAIKQARCLPSPHFPSTPTLPLPGTRRCDSRARSPHPSPPTRHGPTRTRREGAGRAIAGLPAGSRPLKRSLTRPSLAAPLPAVAGDGVTNLGLSSVFLPLAPVGRPPRAGGKRRAEPSVTSWRAHVPPKGRTRPWLRRRLRRERRRLGRRCSPIPASVELSVWLRVVPVVLH